MNNIFGRQKNFVGHAALGGKNRSTTLETSYGNKLHWEANAWFRAAKPGVGYKTPGTHLYYAKPDNGTWAQMRVENASVKQYKAAHDYGNRNVGAPYNWQFRAGAEGFYCSELVAFAWRRAANLDIIPQKKTWHAILPMDLYESPVTYPHRGVIL